MPDGEVRYALTVNGETVTIDAEHSLKLADNMQQAAVLSALTTMLGYFLVQEMEVSEDRARFLQNKFLVFVMSELNKEQGES